MAKNVIISILFSVTLLIGIIVCLICNIAISGNLTWSLIPVSSIVFAWGISFPSIILGKRGIIVNIILSKMTEEPVLDVWDILSIFIMLILAFVFFMCDYAKKRGLMK